MVGVKDKDIKFLKRGEFNKTKASIDSYDFVDTKEEDYTEMQNKLDNISKSLTAKQRQELQEIINFTAYNSKKRNF